MGFWQLMGVQRSGYDTTLPFVTSWLLSPFLLATIRVLFAAYCFTTQFFIWGWQGTHNNSRAIGTSFSYFTVLTYWGMFWEAAA